MANEKTLFNAAIGAVVTIGLSFTGVSPLLGGGVAGYLQGESPKRGARIGAISGALAVAPLLLLGVLAMVAFGMPMGTFGVPGALELVVMLVVMLPMMALWFVGLSTLGGYIGATLKGESRPPAGDASPAK